MLFSAVIKAAGLSSLVVVLLIAIAIACNTDTRYAPGFSEERFERITSGMSQAEVTQLLGAPLFRLPLSDLEVWSYTGPGENPRASYWIRNVYFSSSRSVLRTVSKFELD